MAVTYIEKFTIYGFISFSWNALWETAKSDICGVYKCDQIILACSISQTYNLNNILMSTECGNESTALPYVTQYTSSTIIVSMFTVNFHPLLLCLHTHVKKISFVFWLDVFILFLYH